MDGSQLNSILYKLFFFWFASLSLTWQFQFNPDKPLASPLSNLDLSTVLPAVFSLLPTKQQRQQQQQEGNKREKREEGRGRAWRKRRNGLFDISIRHDRRSYSNRTWYHPWSRSGRGVVWDGFRSGPALSVSANSSALSNSMHVLMKHCWPAAHCQLHCCLDDWSIEGLQAFVMPPPCSDSSTLFLSLAGHRLVSNLRHRHPRAPDARRRGGRGLYQHVGERPKQRPRTSVRFFQRCTPGVGYAHPLFLYLAYLSAREAASFHPTKETRAFVLLLVIPVDSFSFEFIAT